MSTLAQLVFHPELAAFSQASASVTRWCAPSYNQRTVLDSIFDARRRSEFICSATRALGLSLGQAQRYTFVLPTLT
jgi:hypothetical protein